MLYTAIALTLLVFVCVGGALGLFFGVVYISGRVLDVERPSPFLAMRGIRPGTSIRCPYCGAMVVGDASSCPKCERNLLEIVAPTRVYRPGFEEKGEVLVCIRCGRL